jgi:sortase A
VKLSRVNNFLLFAIVVINLYLVITPFVPGIIFWAQEHATTRKQELNKIIYSKNAPSTSGGNRLVIPTILLNTPINEGSTMSTLKKGVWRLPETSSPDRGSNTVIVAHRFTYTNPQGPFYYLNKVQPHDEIGIIWGNKKYLYSVSNIQIVKPNDIGVEAPTKQAELTLYTCTPLWLPKNRLVVTALLESST